MVLCPVTTGRTWQLVAQTRSLFGSGCLTLCPLPPVCKLENNYDPPPPIFAKKNAPNKYAVQWRSVWHKSPLQPRHSTEKMAYGPQNMAYEKPPFCATRTVFVGGGGGLQFVENWVHCKRHSSLKSTFLVIFWGF